MSVIAPFQSTRDKITELIKPYWIYVKGGKIGKDIDQEVGKLAARQVGLTILATLIANLGSLNKIKRVIKVFGMVNATADFDKQPYVINGCSELFVEVFGRENGIAVRSAVGVGSLPENVPVEIEAIFELNE